MSTHKSQFFFKLSLLQSRALTFLSSSLLPFATNPSHMHCMASPSALSVLALLVFISSSLCIFSEAKEFLVGDKTNSWQMPSFPSQSLNKWAEANRFHVGDSLGTFLLSFSSGFLSKNFSFLTSSYINVLDFMWVSSFLFFCFFCSMEVLQ